MNHKRAKRRKNRVRRKAKFQRLRTATSQARKFGLDLWPCNKNPHTYELWTVGQGYARRGLQKMGEGTLDEVIELINRYQSLKAFL